MNAQALLCALAEDPVGRLRWRVLRFFGAPPGGETDRALSDRDCLLAAAHMVLDRRQAAGAAGGNPAFDEARFERLREGGL